MSDRIGPFGLMGAIVFMLLSVNCSANVTAVNSPAYTKEACRSDLEQRFGALLSKEKDVHFYDNRATYRALDIKVDFYKGSEPGMDLAISLRSMPLAYWGFNAFSGEQIPGLPKRARELLDKEPFKNIAGVRCPEASSFWDAEDAAGSNTSRAQTLFGNILMFWAVNGASSVQSDFLRAFGLVFDLSFRDLAVEIKKVSGLTIACLHDYSDFFTDIKFTQLKVLVGTNCKLHDGSLESRSNAFTETNNDMNQNKFLAVLETEIEIKPALTGVPQEEAARELRAEIKTEAEALAHKMIEFVKKSFSGRRYV